MRTFAQKPKATQQTTPSKSTIPGRAHFGQSRERELDSILHLQRTIGNQAVRRLLEANSENIKGQDSSITAIARFGHDFSRIPIHPPAAGPIQTKLTINRSGDEYEQEADRIAAQVLASPAPSAVSGAPPRIQRFSGQSTGHLDAAPASVDQALASPGWPLEPGLRKDMEQRFAQDFSGVRVHSNGAAEQSVREAGAMAYTTGENIVFGAGQYAPGTAEGKRLLAHELTHVVQQSGGMGERLQRAPGGVPTAPVKALEPLESVAQRIARLATGPSSAAVNLKGGPDKVVSVIRNVRTGQIHVGLNTGIPAAATQPIQAAIEAQMQRIAAGEVAVVHTAADAVGGHAEVNALNRAIAAEQAALGHALTAEEIAATFEMHNVWLSGRRRLTTAPRCEHCAAITRGVRVTESLFKAEGGVAVLPGGKAVEAEAIHGEIGGPKPPVKPPTTAPEPVPETVSGVKGPGVPPVGRSAARVAVTGIALNVLLFAVTYYLNKWHAQKQVRKFNSDLKGRLPEVNTRLKNKEAEIVAREKAFPLVYGNITIVYTHDKYAPEDYNEGSMSVQDVAISHQNYQTPAKLIKPYSPMEGKDPLYSLTFSVPLFEEKTVETGVSSLARYRLVRENLTDPSYKVRLSAVITLYKLATQDPSLETLVVRDLLGMLKDGDGLVRLSAAVSLSRLKAKIGIQYIREVMQITKDDKQKKLIQRYLGELEQG